MKTQALALLTIVLFTLELSTHRVIASPQTKVAPVKSSRWSPRQVKAGESLIRILTKNGFQRKQINKVLAEQAPQLQHLKLVIRDPYAVSKESNRLRFKFYDPDKDRFYIFSLVDGFVTLNIENKAFMTKTKKVSGRIKKTLFGSLGSKIKGYKIPHRFRDAYIYNYDLNKVIERGAKYSLTYEEKFDGGRFIRTGELLAASLEIKGKKINRTFLASPEGGGSFISRDLPKGRPLYSPTNYQKISSLFQRRRFHPIRKKKVAHLGVDFAIGWGEPIYAAGDGRVSKRTRSRAMGKYVVVEHSNRMITYYSHLSRFAEDLQKGADVKAGDLLGYIGCTGYCTNPHLHFALKRRGQFVDPLRYLKSYSKRMAHLVEDPGARFLSSEQ